MGQRIRLPAIKTQPQWIPARRMILDKAVTPAERGLLAPADGALDHPGLQVHRQRGSERATTPLSPQLPPAQAGKCPAPEDRFCRSPPLRSALPGYHSAVAFPKHAPRYPCRQCAPIPSYAAPPLSAAAGNWAAPHFALRFPCSESPARAAPPTPAAAPPRPPPGALAAAPQPRAHLSLGSRIRPGCLARGALSPARSSRRVVAGRSRAATARLQDAHGRCGAVCRAPGRGTAPFPSDSLPHRRSWGWSGGINPLPSGFPSSPLRASHNQPPGARRFTPGLEPKALCHSLQRLDCTEVNSNRRNASGDCCTTRLHPPLRIALE